MSAKNNPKPLNISKRLSDTFKRLEDLSFIGKKVALNKSSPKSKPYWCTHDGNGYSRGVENDQVFIFEIKDKDINIAFSINDINNFVDDNIFASIKFNNMKGLDNRGIVVASGKFNYDDLRVRLNEFVKTATIDNYQEKFSELFEFEIPTPSEMRYYLLNKTSEENVEKSNILKCRFFIDDYLPELHAENLKLEKIVNEELAKTTEHQVLFELEKEMSKLQKKISDQKKIVMATKKVIQDEKGYTEGVQQEKKLTNVKDYFKSKGESMDAYHIKSLTGLQPEEFIASFEKRILSKSVQVINNPSPSKKRM